MNSKQSKVKACVALAVVAALTCAGLAHMVTSAHRTAEVVPAIRLARATSHAGDPRPASALAHLQEDIPSRTIQNSTIQKPEVQGADLAVTTAQTGANVARLERKARQKWAQRNPALARRAIRVGSYEEVAHLVKKDSWDALNPVHRTMIRNLIMDARQGIVGVMPCMAPGTNLKIVEAFEGLNSGLEFFYANSYWSNTAAGSHTRGAPMTLSWSIVPDGTALPSGAGEPEAGSNLKARLNTIYGNEATWRPLFQRMFARWSAVSGVRYIEETNDDGTPINDDGTNPGVAGVRGDVRIGGHPIDGNSNILAYNYYPNLGDMVIDTGDSFYNTITSDSLRLRNVLAHEHGHGLGFRHVCPTDQTKLMEPFVSVNFDGPQLDDIQNAQRGYGDALENNDSHSGATDLGPLGNGTVSRSTVSLDGNNDQDFFRFSISDEKLLSATLRPTGGSYLNGPQSFNGTCTAGTTFNASAQRDLQLTVLDNAGNVVASIDGTTEGNNEVLPAIRLRFTTGPFLVRVSGDTLDRVQLYDLDLTLADAPAAPDFTSSAPPTVIDTTDNGNSNGRPDPGETGLALTIPLRNIGMVRATNVRGTLVSLSNGVTVTQASATYPELPPNVSAENLVRPIISVSPDVLCGSAMRLRLDMFSAQGNDSVYITLEAGVSVQTYSGSSVPIPEGTATPATASIPVSGSGAITDLNLGLDNLPHGSVGSLTITLTSPAGTTVTVVDRMSNGGTLTTGSNFNGTVLDDEATTFIQSATDAPFTGSYRPFRRLNAFDGQDANGTWMLSVTDNLEDGLTGSIDAFSLRISFGCAAPLLPNEPPANLYNNSSTFPATAQSTLEDTPLFFNASTNRAITISDPDADTGAIRTTLSVTNGTLQLGGTPPPALTVTGNGTSSIVLTGSQASLNSINGVSDFGYTPTANFSGSATLTITTDDQGNSGLGGAQSDTDSVNITVTAVNDAPVVTTTGSNLAYNENQSATVIDSGLLVSDIDSPNLSGATVSISNGFASGQDVLAFTNQNGITGSYNSNDGVLTLTGSATVATYQTALATINYFNSSDNPSTTVRTVTFAVNDGSTTNESGSAARSITITTINDAPTLTAIADQTAILEDAGAQTVNLSGISAGGESQSLTVTASSNNILLIPDPTVTYTSPNATGSLSYTPVANQSGTAVITVTVSDDGGSISGGVDAITRTFTVTVTSVNDAPTLDTIADPATIAEDSGAQTLNLSGISPGGGETQVLTVTASSSNTGLIPSPTVSYTSPNATGSLSYTPVANQTGTATITVSVSDDGGTANSGVNTILRMFTVSVGAVADRPSVTNATVNEDTQSTSGLVISRNPADGVEVTHFKITNISKGALFQNDGTTAIVNNDFITFAQGAAGLKFTPAANFNGSGSFQVQASISNTNDGLGGATVTAIITVVAVPDAPTAVDDVATVDEDTPVEIVVSPNDSDLDNDALNVARVAVTAATRGTVTINPNNTLRFVPETNFHGESTLSYTISDGILESTANVGITVRPINDAPIAQDGNINTDEDTPNAVVLSATDIDNTNLTYSIVTPPSRGTLSGSGANLTYTPAANFNGPDSFTFKANDGQLDSSLATVSIAVGGINDAPVAKEDSYTLTGLQPLQVTAPGVLGNDTDDEGDTLRASVVTPPTRGTLTLTTNGSFTYTPEVGFNGEDVFTYRAKDGNSNSNIANVTLNISGNVSRSLALDLPQSTLGEGAAFNATVTLSRPVTADVVVTLLSSDTSAATVPASVTLPAGSTLATFEVKGVQDGMVDANQAITISAGSTEYGVAQTNLTITNTDVPTLTLTVAPATFNENGGPAATRATLTRNVIVAQRLTVKLNSTDASEVRVPQEVIMPSGATSTTFWVEAVDDRVADGAQSASIVARANGFVAGAARVRVEDNGRVTQALTLTLQNGSGLFGEATPGDLKGSVSIPTTSIRDEIIMLSSSDTSLVGMPRAVLLRAGQKSVGFVFRILDNRQAQGTQRVVLLAKLSGIASAFKEVRVVDNDEPMLALTLARSSVDENSGSLMATLVARNTPTGSGMLVKLGNNGPARVSTPTEVWIPPGRSSATFPISIVDNSIADGNHSITLTVSRTGFRSGTTTLQVLDNDSAAISNSTASSVKLSTATAQVASSSLRLRFTGALDAADATEAARWSVQVNGQVVEVESLAYDIAIFSVKLTLAEGSLKTGDPIKVLWKNLRDKQGHVLNGQTVVTTH
jgi:subtilisin-like proprotein convertase family protein